MTFEVRRSFVNYYELLEVAEDASITTLQEALRQYRANLEVQMNNPLSMTAARDAMNEHVPAIEHHLLSSHEARVAYDRQLADFQQKHSDSYEPEDDEGLDDSLDTAFLFDPYNDFDTEIPAFTLRDIAQKLDQEWVHTIQWITDTSSATHSFVNYLTFVTNRPRMTEKIESIIRAVWQPDAARMATNEGIERCIDILDPHIERPIAGIYNPNFDGRVLDAGRYIPDLPARYELILGHEGIRGCAFGTLESRTSWLTFEGVQTSVRFALMPQGTSPAIGLWQVKIPLSFNVGALAHNADHAALVILRLENQVSDIEIPFQVLIHVTSLPPRVIFVPQATRNDLAWAGVTRRGVAARTVVKVINTGDETLAPLTARIASSDPGINVQPREFHHNDLITITIHTSSKPFGKPYHVALPVNYITPGARGPEKILVQGEILPTPWQSMARKKRPKERVIAAFIYGFIDLLVLSVLAALTHANAFWVVFAFLITPAIFVFSIRSIVSVLMAHRQQAGDTKAYIEYINPWLLSGTPTAIALALVLLCVLTSNPVIALFIGGLFGFILGFAFGFIQDETRPEKMNTPDQQAPRQWSR